LTESIQANRRVTPPPPWDTPAMHHFGDFAMSTFRGIIESWLQA
jgi:hypothetical protein